MTAATVAAQAARIAARTATWDCRRPSLGEVLDVAERLAELVWRVNELGAGEGFGAPARTATALAQHVATTARALRTNTTGWLQCVPLPDSVHGAQRLNAELACSLAALSRLFKGNLDELVE